ncbi:MAG: ferric iron uptake transcriptional regulator [Burkholderiales bacterium]|jgi:Fur family ferric uptake transcriptional regulator|nr:ferric iron uptake transcriptional regulator [Burkholderiales bacterium]
MTTTPKDLKDKGLKATLPRLRIIRLFETSAERHLTAEDVYRILLAENIDIGLATIYRVLTQFEQAGLLLRHNFETNKAVYEINPGTHHDHIVCLRCGRVEEFFDADIEKRQDKIAESNNFEIVDHSLCIYGYCASGICAEERKAENREA